MDDPEPGDRVRRRPRWRSRRWSPTLIVAIRRPGGRSPPPAASARARPGSWQLEALGAARQEGGAGVRGPDIDAEHAGPRPILASQRSQGPGQPRAPPARTSAVTRWVRATTPRPMGAGTGRGLRRQRRGFLDAPARPSAPSTRGHRSAQAAPGMRRLRRRASSGGGAHARTGHPRCRSARRWPGRTPGTRPAPRTNRRPSWPRGCVPPFSGKNASGSVWAHSARSCQDVSSISSRGMTSASNIRSSSTRCDSGATGPDRPET